MLTDWKVESVRDAAHGGELVEDPCFEEEDIREMGGVVPSETNSYTSP